MKFYSKNLERCRKKAGLSQAEAGKRIGVRQPDISKYESEATAITVDVLCKLAEAYGLDLSEFFDFDGNEPITNKVGHGPLDDSEKNLLIKEISNKEKTIQRLLGILEKMNAPDKVEKKEGTNG